MIDPTRPRFWLAVAFCALLALVGAASPARAQPLPCPGDNDPSLPPPPGCAAAPIPGSNFCLRLDARPRDAGPLYETVLALGPRRTAGLSLRLPVGVADPGRIRVELSQPGPWVRSLDGGILDLAIGELGPGAVLTATISIAAPGQRPLPATRASLSWSDGAGATVRSNRVRTSGAAELTVAPERVARGQSARVSLDGLSSRDRVSLWLASPDGRSVVRAGGLADPQGSITLPLPTGDLASGEYTVVAQGACGQTPVVGRLVVAAP